MNISTVQRSLILICTLILSMSPLLIPEHLYAADTDQLWRVQIMVVTGDVEDAGTDDDISIGLNSNNQTWLDYGRDDFERDSKYTYDLLLTNARTIGDIQNLTISKNGSDGLCLKYIVLFVNGRSIYVKNLGTPCHWLDNQDGHSRSYTINAATLRLNSRWQNYRQPSLPQLIAQGIPRSELEARLEGVIGHFIKGNKLHWGHISNRAVEVSKKDNQTIHVDLDLAYDVSNWWDPEVDVDFDVRFSCQSGIFTLTTLNYQADVDSSWYSELLLIGLIVDSRGNSIAGQAFTPITKMIETGFPVCPTVIVQSDGSLGIALR